MNCDQFARSLPDRPQLLDEEQSLHASECRYCSVMADQRRQLADGFQALGREWKEVGAPPRVEAQLLTAFRSKPGIPRRRPAHPWIPALAWATAAVAVLAMALVLIRDQRPSRNAVAAAVPIAATQAPDWADPATAEEEGFIPLPNAEQIDTDEAVNMVRVELPRSAMIALGYPVNADRASEKVEADVVLGADGLARAVRFVDE